MKLGRFWPWSAVTLPLLLGCGGSDSTPVQNEEPLPVEVARVGDLLVPFDVNQQDLEGPGGWSTQYGKSPEIIPTPHGRVIDVLGQDYAGGFPLSHAHVPRLGPSKHH